MGHSNGIAAPLKPQPVGAQRPIPKPAICQRVTPTYTRARSFGSCMVYQRPCLGQWASIRLVLGKASVGRRAERRSQRVLLCRESLGAGELCSCWGWGLMDPQSHARTQICHRAKLGDETGPAVGVGSRLACDSQFPTADAGWEGSTRRVIGGTTQHSCGVSLPAMHQHRE